MKPSLVVSKGFVFGETTNTLGTEMLEHVVKSGLFDISYHNESISISRGERGTILYYNGKKIYVDFWEYMLPTYSRPVYDAKFDLIIKLQHYNITPELLEKACQRKKIFLDLTSEERVNFIKKVIPWSFFCSGIIRQFIGKEDILEQLPIERIGFFCGKSWKCRKGMREKLMRDGIEYIASDRFPGPDYKKPVNDRDYIHRMRTSKYGIVFAGRRSMFTEAKNRREIDYMILKKPLLLNYKPFYYDPLIENKHYIYIDEKTNISEIEKHHDLNEIVKNAYEWYKNNASPEGYVKSFLKIMQDKFPN